MSIIKNNLKINIALLVSIIATPNFAIPAYSEENKVLNSTETKATEYDASKKLEFISKFEVNLNEVSNEKVLFDLPSVAITFELTKGSQYKVFVNDLKVEDRYLGKTQINDKTNKATYTFYGVSLQSGKNLLKVQELNTSGDVIKEYSRDVYVKSKPAKIKITSTKIPADGRTIGKIYFEVKDEWDNPVPNDYPITIRIEQGEIKSKDQDEVAYGFQLKTKNGKAELEVKSPNQVGISKIDVDAGVFRERGTIEYSTPYREPMLLAIGKTQTNYSFVNGVDTSYSDDKFDLNQIRASKGLNLNFGGNVFGQGTVFNDYLLTLAYSGQGRVNSLGAKNSILEDKSRKLNGVEDDQNIFLRDRAEDRLYPIYGDSSQLNQIVVANSPYYFKLEKDLSSLSWGDFSTAYKSMDFTTPTMGTYNRIMTGGKFTLDLPNITNLDIFGALPSQTFDKDEIRGGGVSGPYFIKNYPIVNGTERITIETRDRTDISIPQRVLKTKTLNRLSDYNIDYSTGSIIFSEPVASYDENLNPNVIVVNYEYYPKDPSSGLVLGARIKQPLPFGSFAGASYVKDFSNTTPYQLWGANIGEKLGDNLDLIGEYANSFADNKMGSSWRTALSSKLFDNLTLQGEYQLTDKNFINKTGSSFSPGSERYSARGTYKPFLETNIALDYTHSKVFESNQTLQTFNTKATQTIFSNDFSLGFENRSYPDPQKPTNNLTAGLLSVGYKSPTFYNFSLNAGREQNILKDVDISKPTVSTVGLDYNLGSNMKLFIKDNFYEKPQDKANKLANAIIVGIDTGFTNESSYFNSVNVGTKYQIDSALDSRTAQNRFGLNSKIGILPGLAIGGDYERVSGKNPVLNFTEDYNAYSLSAEFAPSWSGLRVSGKYDIRDGDRASKLYSLTASGTLGDDFGIFGKFNHGESTDTERRLSTQGSFGLAYRPLTNDLFNALATYKITRDISGIGFISDTLKHTASIEGVFEPHRAWEIYSKLALKVSNDVTSNEKSDKSTEAKFKPQFSNITLGLLRATYKFNYNFDVVGEYRNTMQWETATSLNDFTGELGYYPIKNLRIALGYNLFGNTDRDLIASNYTAQGPYMNASFSFDNIGALWNTFGVLTKKDQVSPTEKIAKN